VHGLGLGVVDRLGLVRLGGGRRFDVVGHRVVRVGIDVGGRIGVMGLLVVVRAPRDAPSQGRAPPWPSSRDGAAAAAGPSALPVRAPSSQGPAS